MDIRITGKGARVQGPEAGQGWRFAEHMLQLSHTQMHSEDEATYYFSWSPRETLLARLSWRSNSTWWSSLASVSCSPRPTLENVCAIVDGKLVKWKAIQD